MRNVLSFDGGRVSALVEVMISHGLAFRIDGDVVAPLSGNARVPHAVRGGGGQATAGGRAREGALHAGQRPEPDLGEGSQREAVSLRRRQVVAISILLLRSGLIEAVEPNASDLREGSSVNVAWTGEDLRAPPTEAEIEAFIAGRDRARALGKRP